MSDKKIKKIAQEIEDTDFLLYKKVQELREMLTKRTKLPLDELQCHSITLKDLKAFRRYKDDPTFSIKIRDSCSPYEIIKGSNLDNIYSTLFRSNYTHENNKSDSTFLDFGYEAFGYSDTAKNLNKYINLYLDEDKFDYYSESFRKLRLKVFMRDGEMCAKCKAKSSAGISLTIDNIKPVSKYPDKALDIDNLQVLYWECNQKKSNKHETDYRS